MAIVKIEQKAKHMKRKPKDCKSIVKNISSLKQENA